MSRRKQAFPVRVEGNRLHLSESESSCNQKSSEPSTSEVLDESNLNVSAEVTHVKPINAVSNGEFIVSGVDLNEPKTPVLAYEDSKVSVFTQEHDFHETKPDVTLPSVTKVESAVILEDDPITISACSSSFTIKERDRDTTVKTEDSCASHTDEKWHVSGNAQDHQSHKYADGHNEGEKSAEICRDLNVRTSLVCKAGTEIKIIQNSCAEKVEVQCVTHLTDNIFEIHKKTPKQIKEFSDESSSPKVNNQKDVYTEQDDVESNETVLQDILQSCKADSEGPGSVESLTSLPYTGSLSATEGSSLYSSADEAELCERQVSSPEPDSSTILLDESELNISGEVAYAESPHIFSNEFVVTGAVYNDTNTDVLSDDESQLALPPIKVEPCVILEEEEVLNVPDCIGLSSMVKDESLSTFPVEEKQGENIINIEELKPLHLCHSYKEPVKNAGILNSNDSSLTCRVTSQCLLAEKEGVQSLTTFPKSTFKAARKQLEKITGSFQKDCTLDIKDQNQVCTVPKDISESEDPPLEAILPCVDLDLSLTKEESGPVLISSLRTPVIQETNFASFPVGERVVTGALYDCEDIRPAVEVCSGVNVETSTCQIETRSKTKRKKSAAKEVIRTSRSKRNAAKAGRKRRAANNISDQGSSAPKTKEQNQVCAEHTESPPKAILPCVDVDPSLLKDEPELPVISACKDPFPVNPIASLLNLSDAEDKQSENKIGTESDNTQEVSEEDGVRTSLTGDSDVSNFDLDIPRTRASWKEKPCVTDEEIQCMVDFTREALDQREKKLQQIREAVYRKRALETEEQRQARLEKDKLRQRKRRAEETEEQREKRLLTMRLHKRIKRSMHSATGLQKNFLDYYMEEMFKYPETQEEQGSPLNMIVSIDPSWVVRTVEKQQFKCAVETEDQRKTRLEKDMLRQRKKRAEETPDQRAKRLETMRINKRIRRAMETEEQRHKRLEYSRERQLYRRLNETEQQRKERLEREKLRQREKRASETTEERELRLKAARERMRLRLTDPSKVSEMIDDLLSGDSLSS